MPISPTGQTIETGAAGRAQPVLSIVIPTCNRPTLLRRAVTAALAAATAHTEILVIDDGDTPAARALTGLADPRLRLHRNTGGRGEPAARNLGLRIAHAPLVLFLDDDDEMCPDYPARVVKAAAQENARWGGAATLIRRENHPDERRRKTTRLGVMSKHRAFQDYMIATSAGFWADRHLLLGLGGFNETLRIDCDTDICCRLIAGGHYPHYDPRPGTIVHRGWTAPDQQGQLTRITARDRAAACYEVTFMTSARSLTAQRGASRFLALRYLRRARQAGMAPDLPKVLDRLSKRRDRVIVRLAHRVNTLGQRQVSR